VFSELEADADPKRGVHQSLNDVVLDLNGGSAHPNRWSYYGSWHAFI